ncbi:MAG: hypothetical protein AAB197_06960 [Deltaproteobacteria bacterium]
MKKKKMVGALIEKGIIAKAAPLKEREAAYQLICHSPFKLTPEQFRQLLEEDVWGV